MCVCTCMFRVFIFCSYLLSSRRRIRPYRPIFLLYVCMYVYVSRFYFLFLSSVITSAHSTLPSDFFIICVYVRVCFAFLFFVLIFCHHVGAFDLTVRFFYYMCVCTCMFRVFIFCSYLLSSRR